MQIESLKNILLRDLSDLEDIAEILEPGYCLSKIEVQILKSRITSLSNEIKNLLSQIIEKSNLAAVDNDLNKPKISIGKDDNSKDNLQIDSKTVVKKSTEAIITHKASDEKTDISIVEKNKSESKSDKLVVEKKAEVIEVKKSEPAEKLVKEPEVSKSDTVKQIQVKVENQTKVESTKDGGVSRKTLADQYIDKNFSLNEMVGQPGGTTDRASSLGQKPVSDINKAIKINERLGFIRELFAGDAQLYANTIDKLNNFEDFEQAFSFLSENFVWDQDSENFKMFIDIVYRRYIQ